MIEVNLLPGGRKRAARKRGFSFSLPSFGGGGGGAAQDKWVLGAALAVGVALGLMGYLYVTVTGQEEEVQVSLEAAQRDSVRFADLIGRTDALLARRDSIAEKIAIIQDIDQERYIWPHVMDEVARALPDYTWLDQITDQGGGQIQILGFAGNNFALAVFMRQLEASPWIRNVTPISSSLNSDQQSGQLVYAFTLTAQYEQPPIEFLETVPLFDAELMELDEGEEAAAGEGTEPQPTGTSGN